MIQKMVPSLAEFKTENLFITERIIKKAQHFVVAKCWAYNLATTYSHRAYRPTTIGAKVFHFRVRNGTGWFHFAMVTRLPKHCAFYCLFCCGCLMTFLATGVCVVCLIGFLLELAELTELFLSQRSLTTV